LKLYAGTTEQFRADTQRHRIGEKLRAEYMAQIGHKPGPSEVASWQNSLMALSMLDRRLTCRLVRTGGQLADRSEVVLDEPEVDDLARTHFVDDDAPGGELAARGRNAQVLDAMRRTRRESGGHLAALPHLVVDLNGQVRERGAEAGHPRPITVRPGRSVRRLGDELVRDELLDQLEPAPTHHFRENPTGDTLILANGVHARVLVRRMFQEHLSDGHFAAGSR